MDYTPEQEAMIINLLGTAALIFGSVGVSYYTDYHFNKSGNLEFTFESDNFVLSGEVDHDNKIVSILADDMYLDWTLKEIFMDFAVR
jgi:hypothetical protein